MSEVDYDSILKSFQSIEFLMDSLSIQILMDSLSIHNSLFYDSTVYNAKASGLILAPTTVLAFMFYDQF